MTDDVEREKRLAAEAASGLVQDGMMVGLGTGTTVAHLLPALAARHLEIRCVATSPATAAEEAGFHDGARPASNLCNLPTIDFAGVSGLLPDWR